MRECEACGQRLFGHVDRCSHCGHPVAVVAAAGHLSRTAIAGRAGATLYPAPPRSAAAQLGSPAPVVKGAGVVNGAGVVSATGIESAPGVERSDEPSSPASPDFDPDATMRFTPIYRSHSRAKNTAALVGLAVALIAAVASLAWLIGQSVISGRPTPRDSVSASPKATALSTAVPRNATVCTPELARSVTTDCTVARRVFAAVRTLGTDLPDSFRVTITDPENAKKNLTYVCTIHAWIECAGPGETTIYVRRQA